MLKAHNILLIVVSIVISLFFTEVLLRILNLQPVYSFEKGLFVEDARWLNEEFIQLPGSGNQGTQVIIGSLDE